MKIYNTIGFLGGGRIVRAILSGLKNKQALPNRILIIECDEKAKEKLRKVSDVTFAGDMSELKDCEVIFLAIHIPVMGELLEKLKSIISPDTIIVSFAPKVKIAKIQESLNGHGKIIRVNPNVPSMVNFGFNPLVFSEGMNEKEKEEFLLFMSYLGNSIETKEENIEKYAVISAMGPTYLFFQLYKLIDIAVSFGLTEKEAKEAVVNMSIGAAKVIGESNLNPEEVIDLIPSKPLSEDEETIKEIYEKKLKAIYEKLK